MLFRRGNTPSLYQPRGIRGSRKVANHPPRVDPGKLFPRRGIFGILAGETKAKYGKALEDLLAEYPNDFLVLVYRGLDAGDDKRDEWGCAWSSIEGQTGSQVTGHPLGDWGSLKSYGFPDPESPGRFDKAREEIGRGGDIYVIGLALITLFERMHFLRGYTNLLEDLYYEKEKLNHLADRITQFDLGIIKNWAKAGADCVMLSDDWGTQESLMISPKLWREFFKPRYKKIIHHAHENGMDVFFHSCGRILEILPELIECGVDILNPIQPNAMDPSSVGRTFSGKVCFAGAIDSQTTLRTGTPKDVRAEVRERIATLGTDRGGYICCPATTVMPDVPLENLRAMFQAAKEHKFR